MPFGRLVSEMNFDLPIVLAVGTIMGLGDRHANNILIDLQLGQLVHIDLGRSNPRLEGFCRDDVRARSTHLADPGIGSISLYP